MVAALEELRYEFETLRKRLLRVKRHHVNRAEDKDAIRQFVRRYFEVHRGNLLSRVGDDALRSLDGTLQEFLRCAQRRTEITRCRRLLRACQRDINQLESVGIASFGPEHTSGSAETERALIETLESICPSAAACYEQGLSDLQHTGRKSWRGTVVELREALREALDTLAPDEDVTNSKGFQLEAGAKRPTMRQKVRFVLAARQLSRAQTKPAEEAVDAVEDAVGRLARAAYDRASAGVHTTVGIEEAKRVKKWVTLVLEELLEVGR
jgi:hypothetical protein